MNRFKQIIFTAVMVMGLSICVSAQRNDPKKPPPKDPGPVVVPREKPPPPRDKPREGDKPKKPEMEYSVMWRKDDGFVA